MLATQIPRINDEFSRCEESSEITDHGKGLSPSQKTDATIKGSIDRAIWNDDVLRAIEYYEIDLHVKNGIVFLYGHIAGASSKSRIENALRSIPGILGIQNNLVLDDKLTLDVAASLGDLEHSYDCKFFTGASHGVISLNGMVSDENVKLLAEQRAASHPNVRGVIEQYARLGGRVGIARPAFPAAHHRRDHLFSRRGLGGCKAGNHQSEQSASDRDDRPGPICRRAGYQIHQTVW